LGGAGRGGRRFCRGISHTPHRTLTPHPIPRPVLRAMTPGGCAARPGTAAAAAGWHCGGGGCAAAFGWAGQCPGAGRAYQFDGVAEDGPGRHGGGAAASEWAGRGRGGPASWRRRGRRRAARRGPSPAGPPPLCSARAERTPAAPPTHPPPPPQGGAGAGQLNIKLGTKHLQGMFDKTSSGACLHVHGVAAEGPHGGNAGGPVGLLQPGLRLVVKLGRVDDDGERERAFRARGELLDAAQGGREEGPGGRAGAAEGGSERGDVTVG
jgi:hypothetical protein